MKIQNPLVFILSFLGLLLAICSLTCYADSSAKKEIALTFDDGPHEKYTEEVLNILKENHIHATFFVMGGSVRNHPELLKQAFADGNAIGNHTYSHPNLSKQTDSVVAKELNKTNELIYQTIHVRPVLMRPPYGFCSARCTKVVNDLGFRKITWDYMVNDWDINKTTADILAASVIHHAGSGEIIGMHDGGGNREKTVQALPKIISTLKKQGYQFVTVPELLGIDPYRK